jgi:hypothetical protein
VPFALAALWLWQGRAAAGSLAMAALTTLVKATLAPLAALLGLALLLAGRWRALVVGCFLSLALAIAAFAPIWSGSATLANLLRQAQSDQYSAGMLLLVLLEPLVGALALPIARGVLALVGAWLVWLTLRDLRSDASALDVAGIAVRLGLILLACVPLSIYSHYVLPLIVLAAVASDARVRPLVLSVGFGLQVGAVLSVASLLGGVTGEQLHVIGSVVLCGGFALGLLLFNDRAGWTTSDATTIPAGTSSTKLPST